MLYLIGGASRSGKTLLARRLLTERGLPYLSVDWLMMGFTNGIPAYGIHDRLFPDDIARRLWPFLQAMAESMLGVGHDHVIEGEALLPELLRDFLERHPGRVRTCFLGYTEVAVEVKMGTIRRHSDASGDWLLKESEEYLRAHVEHMIAHSRLVLASCREHGLPYFDTSADFTGALDRAEASLFPR